ncbi:MAG: NAD-dependent epimerase/dehydratase family protein [Chthoniobacterales bacterium]
MELASKTSLPSEDLEHFLAHTRDLWEDLRGKRIFVTGATGFFGMWLLETFCYANDQLNLGAELVGLSRNPEAFAEKAPHLVKHPAITMHRGDVRDFDFPYPFSSPEKTGVPPFAESLDSSKGKLLKKKQAAQVNGGGFPKGKFSHVIHAGTTSSAPVPDLEMLDTIIGGTRRTLDFSLACGAERFLFVSSGAVYGKLPSDVAHVSENYLGAPDVMNSVSAYGEGKRAAELLCAIAHQEHGMKTTIARCFAFVGPHLPLDAHFAIGNFVRDGLAGKTILLKSSGASRRSYLYAADLAVWLWTILFKGEVCFPYNVGSNEGVTVKELAEKVASILGQSVSIEKDASQQQTNYVPDTSRAEKELHLKNNFTLEVSIDNYVSWTNNK